MPRSVTVGSPLPGVPSFVGGLRLPIVFLNFGWPSARLTLCNEGLRIGPSCFLFYPFCPRRSFKYDDLAEVQATGNNKLRILGIRFSSRLSGKWVIFWTFSSVKRAEILETLSTLTDSVNDVPIRLNYSAPGPRVQPEQGDPRGDLFW